MTETDGIFQIRNDIDFNKFAKLPNDQKVAINVNAPMIENQILEGSKIILLEVKAYCPPSEKNKLEENKENQVIKYERSSCEKAINQITTNYQNAQKYFVKEKLICFFLFNGAMPTEANQKDLNNCNANSLNGIRLYFYRKNLVKDLLSELKFEEKIRKLEKEKNDEIKKKNDEILEIKEEKNHEILEKF